METSNNEPGTGTSPRVATRSPRATKPGKTKYSNAKIDSSGIDSSKITLETQETIEEMKRTKAILAVSYFVIVLPCIYLNYCNCLFVEITGFYY